MAAPSRESLARIAGETGHPPATLEKVLRLLDLLDEIARYASALGGSGAIEADINYMMREPLFGLERKDSVTLGGARARGIMVVDRHEIVAGKLVALLSRRAARDLFDARRIFDIPDLDWRWIKAAMLGLGAASRADWRRVTVDSSGADPGELRDKLLICLPRERFAAHGSAEA